MCLVLMASEQEEGTEVSPLVQTDNLSGAVGISVYSVASLVGLESVRNEVLWFRL